MDDIVKEAREFVEEAGDCEKDNRKNWLEDVRFSRLDQQWTDEELKSRKQQNLAALTTNKLAPAIRQVVNDARMNRANIKVQPVDDKADVETAEVLSGLIRNIWVSSDGDAAVDTAVDHAVSGGFGYWRVNVEYANDVSIGDDVSEYGVEAFERDLVISRVSNPLSVYGDPTSCAVDSSDWECAAVIDTLSKAQFKRKYKGAAETNFDHATWSGVTAPWMTDKTVQVAEFWKRERTEKMIVALSDGMVMYLDEYEKMRGEYEAAGITMEGQPRPIPSWKVTQYCVSGAEKLSETVWAGKYIPIIPLYGDEVNVEGVRHFRSLIRGAKDANRMYNFWSSTASSLLALQPRVPFIGRKGSFETDSEKWDTINSFSHTHLEYDGPEMPQQQQPPVGSTAMLEMAAMCSDDIKTVTGIYDASLGARSNETSGRAINARKIEGDISTYHFISNRDRAITHTGRILVDLIPKVYATERTLRIIGNDDEAKNVRVNGEQSQVQEQGDGMAAGRIHDIRTGRYDAVVSSGPSFNTRREESATQMMELIARYPDAAPIIGDLVAKNLDWPGADEIAKRLKKMLPPELQDDENGENPEVTQLVSQLEQMQQAMNQMESKAGMEGEKLAIERYKAETDRMQAMPFDAAQIQQLVQQTMIDLLQPDQLEETQEQATF